MNRKYWINRFNLNENSDVVFYQNPELFRTNSFKKEDVIKIYVITGIGNSHSKNNGKRVKICLVKEQLN